MKRLSQTWKQRRTSERSSNHVLKQRTTNVHPSVEIKGKDDRGDTSKSPSASFNLSYGFELDAAGLSEVDKIEQHFLCDPPPLSPTASCKDVKQGQKQKTPKMAGQTTSTPHLGRGKGNGTAFNNFGPVRGRISTPIEDSEQVALFSSTQSPVFPPLEDHAFDMFEGSADTSNLARKSSENKAHNTSKSQILSGLSTSFNRSILEPDFISSGSPLELSSWGLPPVVLKRYHEMGITRMFEWQAECLRTGRVLMGGNLVYSAPTSAGKTMVAELLMLKRVLETKRKAFFILPFISVAREKMFYLQRLYQEAGVRVDGYMGSHAPPGGLISVDIAVCTIEKANSLLNRLLEEKKALSSLGIVVVDEMHMIGDPHRGYLLELFLTKVRYISGYNDETQNEDNVTSPAIQIVGMSATLPNLDMLAKWLSADLYFTDHRPVPLTEMIKIGCALFDGNLTKIREITGGTVAGDDDHVIPLCKETIVEGHSVLVFCPTKNWCEKLAESIARHFAEIGSLGLQGEGSHTGSGRGFVKASNLLTFDYVALKEVIEQLKRTQVGLDSVLSRLVPHAVAFHHAGLTFDERDIIEGAFRQGSIRVLVATSTLSSGVNLPARRVIIRTPIFHGKLVDALVYKQMAGRAGRKGVDALGESVLICKPAERQRATSLLNSQLKAVQSCLLGKDDNGGIKRALLEVICSGVVTRPQDVERYAGCTFFASVPTQQETGDTDAVIKETVKFLVEREFVRLQKCEENKENTDENKERQVKDQRYVSSQLGMATLTSALSPDEALVVFAEVQKARKCFVLESELHIIYQVTPIYIQDQWPNIDWYQYLRIWERLPANMRRVADLVGIEEAFLARAIRGRILTRTDQQRQSLAVHRRFFAALALQDLVHEIPLNVVSRRYGANRGMLQALQGSAATFAGMVTVFCQKLGWTNMELLLSQFQSRLSFGVERELCDLVRVSLLNAARARMLYNAGYHTIASMASAPPSEVENILHNAAPFVSGLKHGQETETEVRERSEARVIWVAGRKGLTLSAAAKLIVNEAKQLLQADVAQLGIEWRPLETAENNNEQGVREGGNRAENVGSTSSGLRVGETMQITAAVSNCKRSDEKSKTNTETKENEVCPSLNSGKKIVGVGRTEKRLAGPSSDRQMDPIQCDGDLERPLRNVKAPVPKRHDCPNVKVKGQLSHKTRPDAAFKSDNEECVTVPETLQQSSHTEKRDQKDPSPVSVRPPVVPSVAAIGNESTPCSRGKRRPQVAEICESREKVKKKEAAETDIQEVARNVTTSAFVELSADSELFSDPQSVSMELYSEPFEGEEPFDQEKTKCPSRDDDKVMLDSQKLPKCSLSDTFLMECDMIEYHGVQGSVENGVIKASSGKDLNKHEANIVTSVTLNDLTCGEEQNMIGECDTHPRFQIQGTEEFRAGQSFEFLPSVGSLAVQSPTRNTGDDGASADRATNSFSLHLSSSDGFSDLSSLAMSELLDKEAETIDLQGETEIAVNLGEAKFTKLRDMNPAKELSKHDDDKSPAKKIPDDKSPAKKIRRNEARQDGAFDVADLPISDVFVCTPPREIRHSPADFTTKTSATPLSSRKRRSPSRSPYSNAPDEGLSIIDVTGHEQVFSLFLDEWLSQKRFSLAVACERTLDNVPRIGGRFTNVTTSEGSSRGLKVEGEDQVIVGVAVSWGGKDAYYVSLKEHAQSETEQPDDSQVESAVDINLTIARRLNALKSVVQNLSEKEKPMVCFDVKEHCKAFARSAGISLNGPVEDPKVASWLLDPGAKEKSLHQLVGQYIPEEAPLLEGCGGGLGTGGLALAYQCQQSGRVRACVESVLVLPLMTKLRPLVEAEGLMEAFTKVEMPSLLCLARMELNGFGFSDSHCEHLKNILQAKLRTLEEEAYRLANHSFSLTSREDVAQVLFVELKLPHDEDGQVTKRKTLGVARRGASRATKHLSTNKEVLEKLKHLHPLPGLIMEWRRINTALTKVVFPLQKEKCINKRLNMPRIHSLSQTHTATGRVSFAEPNLQNVPKDFDISLPMTIAESPPLGDWNERSCSRRGQRRENRRSTIKLKSGSIAAVTGPNYAVSMRTAFVPFQNGVLFAADYSQLELRLIAHLANDERLCRILNRGADVFRMIAGELFRVPAVSITDDQRQHAKQVCYGIIYGIGAKALGEQLGLTEEEAALFTDKFASRYVGVKRYLKETVEQCKKQGFVRTVTGRKRFLPAINSTNAHAHSQAARQAVNTTVQGSAADLVKTAMVNIDRRLAEEFPSCTYTHRHAYPDLHSNDNKNRREHSKADIPPLVGGYFVLQLHDELLFEVSVDELRRVAQIVKNEMENAMKLTVALPVKMKAGPSWGNMAEFEL
ncbi:DNA polymerase theta-like [Montipora capricornis]|uniref:DNA polymerase theta-like n=1 Tax=Montipora capricornis TaxID=246305 RepID=UPI0035F1E524